MKQLDYKGNPIPQDETDDTIVSAYEINPCCSSNSYDLTIIRGWQDMLNHLETNIGLWLDEFQDDDFEKGVKLTITLIKIRRGDLPDRVGDH